MGMQFNTLLRALIAGGVTQQYMTEGINLSPNYSYSSALIFSNVCYKMSSFRQFAGSGGFSEDQGILTANVGTDEFRAVIFDGTQGMPAGTYTVRNPSAAWISFGNYVTSSTYSGAYTNATSFTFTYTGGANILALFVKGSLLNGSGNLVVLAPGTVESWDGGSVWNPDYVAFHSTLKARILRMMDWGQAATTVEVDWADRTQDNKISFLKSSRAAVPLKYMVDFANRVGADPWICIPYRASSDYVTQMATYIAANLSPGLRLWVEHGNEIWNTSAPFATGTSWITYDDFTRYSAIANFGANTYTQTAHGLNSDDVVHCFATKANLDARIDAHVYVISGGGLYVVKIDANTFQLRTDPGGGGSLLPVVAGQIDLLYCKDVESGKTADLHGNYGRKCIRNWDILDAILGVNNYNRMVVRHAANISSLTNALAATGVSARATHISCAPYFYSLWWAGAVDITSGTFTPKVWFSGTSAGTFHIAVYAAGATPSEADIIAGTGAINKQSTTQAYVSGTWTDKTAVTGLSNGTTYQVFFLYAGAEQTFISSQSLVASATSSTAYFYDTTANQALRDRRGIKDTSIANATAFMAAGGSIPMVCYEGGTHNVESGPAQVNTWLKGTYQESDDFAGVIEDNLSRLASIGVQGHCYYAEILDNVFSIANTVTDVTDKRFLKLASFAGRVAKKPVLSVGNQSAAAITALPTLPYVVETLPAEAGRTYTIIGGNSSGNLDISGNNLRLISATGIDWGTPVNNTVYLEALRDGMSDQFMLSFFTGNAWYESDAKFAWSTITDTDTASVNPSVGSAIALTSGTAAVANANLWEMQGNSYYYNSTAIASNTPASGTPVLFAFVMDKTGLTGSFKNIATFGTGPYLKFDTNSTDLVSRGYFGATSSIVHGAISALPSGSHVYWIYMNGASSPTMYSGRDQNDVGNIYIAAAAGANFLRGVSLGDTASVTCKLGSCQVVSRAGMTLADAKAIVAKMQAHHGIA